MDTRRAYPSDVSDEEWAFVAPYLTLLPEDAGQRRYPLREVFNGLRYLIKSGAPWRMIPHDLPPWIIVDQQTRRWLEAGWRLASLTPSWRNCGCSCACKLDGRGSRVR
jgi:transposase